MGKQDFPEPKGTSETRACFSFLGEVHDVHYYVRHGTRPAAGPSRLWKRIPPQNPSILLYQHFDRQAELHGGLPTGRHKSHHGR